MTVTPEMIEAGKACFVAALDDPDHAGDGRVFAEAYLAMRALDPDLSSLPTRRREEADSLAPLFPFDCPLRDVAQQMGKSASQIAGLARDLEKRGIIESRWIGHYSIKEYRRTEEQHG